ncbi:protein kinase domain-containing protein [Archangium sp.]|uniref:protein kinase domain-containing protein n=1 Tax=Archangium sp. TaxID=1872627 RepID=UPI00389B0D8F
MSQVRYQTLGPLIPGEGNRPSLALALEEGVAPRPVVLVWAPAEVVQDATQHSRLRRETERAVVFEHPNILRVHGLVTLEGRVARVTEFADGEPLRQVLEVGGKLPPALAALVAADAATGVHYAHVAGNDDGTPLIHGDLRPETVMVSFSGVCKVSGYGALGVAPRESNGRRVRNRRLYSAPEQLMGGREASSVLTDVFLLGLLLYECLSGRKPFQDSIEPDKAILNRPLPPLPAEIPLALNEVVRRATAKRSGERYPSALAFREALVAVVGELPPPSALAELLGQRIPPDNAARVARKKTLEQGIAAAMRLELPPATAPMRVIAPRPSVDPAEAPTVPATPTIPPRTEAPGIEATPTVPPRAEPWALAVPKDSSEAPTLPATPVVPARPAAPASPRRPAMPLVLGVGTLLLVAAVGTVWSKRKPAELTLPDDAGEEEATPSFDAPVLLDAAPTDAGVRPPVQDAGTPAAPVATPPPTMVQLNVNPEVTVTIDGRAYGHSPLTVPLQPGRHTLTLADEARGLRMSRMIDVRATPEPVSFTIHVGMGSVLIHAPSGARVSIDGEDLGAAPVSEKTLFEGEHRIKVTQNEAVWEKAFSLPGAQRLVFNVDLEAGQEPAPEPEE